MVSRREHCLSLATHGQHGTHAQSGAPTLGERAAEDVTGLRMLEEFLAKRRRA
jgi:hypothetical protein